ncbi:putative mfs maltose permease [Phaeomoniella chlamydospora]|uniref:Putative mfs maltose permease n=1 Tax=Phaeomoniella chlamydospora TaxID=158046 RepID=A0A0G2EZG9_PHACM|nr:putative mfs maltose permease [Phaeomoniella chlamydospora]
MENRTPGKLYIAESCHTILYSLIAFEVTMSFAEDEEKGNYRARHASVSHYVANTNTGHDAVRRRSSVVPARSVSAEGDRSNDGILNQKDDTLRRMSVAVPNLAELTADAKAAAETERYDTWLLANFYGTPSFSKKYGKPSIHNGVTSYQVPAKWQSALTNGTYTAQIIGLMCNGIVSERIGYRMTMIGALIAVMCFIFVQFFAANVNMLLAGYILSGLPWGVFQTLTVTYAAEVTPVTLRPYLTTYVNLCWVIGQLIASGVLKGFANGTDQWAYRIPYAIQWIWPIPILIISFLAPESPWWLVRHGRIDDARKALTRLTSPKNKDSNLEDTIAMMIYTNELEIQQIAGTTYWDCFKGVDRRRTELTCMTWLIQQTSGSPMMGWGTYFMEQAGLTVSDAFSLGIGQSAMGFVGTAASWFLMPHFGRRTLYLWGQVAMFIILMVIGGVGIPDFFAGSPYAWASGALLLLLTFTYDITVGPVCYSLVAELPSTRLRIKTVVLARNVYNVAAIVQGAIMPRMINPDALGWRGRTAFFWAGTNLLGLIWTYFRLPEPKGLTYADLDVLFENHVSARSFRHVKVEPYRSDNLIVADPEITPESNEKSSRRKGAFGGGGVH